jgi:hypothetical protein
MKHSAHSEKCPVCKGEGKIGNDNCRDCVSTSTCHGCAGKGWVTVQDEFKLNPAQIGIIEDNKTHDDPACIEYLCRRYLCGQIAPGFWYF